MIVTCPNQQSLSNLVFSREFESYIRNVDIMKLKLIFLSNCKLCFMKFCTHIVEIYLNVFLQYMFVYIFIIFLKDHFEMLIAINAERSQ
jgi:hypothetical protein